jgi:signal transduction histidine kinase
MKPTATLHRDHNSALHPIAQSTIRLGSFSALERTRNYPTGFVSALAHEIRNPLCTINLALEMLNRMEPDEEKREYLSMIMRGSWRIKDLVTRLLTSDLAEEVNNEVCSLHQLLEEVLTRVRDRMILKNISVTREYTATDHRVFLDPEKMKIALTNVVINAIEAMSSGTGELRLVTRSTDEESFLEIHDTGIGINRGDLKRIFEPYFSNKPGGMGIGLSTALDILRANHTRVDVKSEERVGTCFILSFDRK